MKNTVFVVLFLCITNFANGQILFDHPILDEDFITTSSVRYTTLFNYLPDDVIGSPFYVDEFQAGSIYENNELLSNGLFFRYNASHDHFEIKKNLDDDDDKIMFLSKTSKIHVKINKELFIYDENTKGYYQLLFLGNTVNLYKKVQKKYFPAKRARNSFERDILATYKDDFKYYLNQGDDYTEIPSKKNKRLKFFGDRKTELVKYVSKYDLDIMNEEILIKVIRYLDSFEDVSLK